MKYQIKKLIIKLITAINAANPNNGSYVISSKLGIKKAAIPNTTIVNTAGTNHLFKARLQKIVTNDVLVDIIASGRKPTDEEIKANTDIYETTTENVKVLKIMGMWFIDKRDGMMKYRPLGIAAMGPDPAVQGVFDADGKPIAGKDELIDLFWIYYPKARDILANNYVYNRANSSADLSFDDVINARRFSSVIYKSSNGLGDGTIKDYVPRNAEEQLAESQRIKDQILQMENDMWNY